MSDTKINAPRGKQEVVVTRTYHAPRELVFRAVTDPKLIPEWWGPRGLTTTVEKMEVRPGGLYRYIQRDPQGNTFAFNGVYHVAKAPELLIYTREWEGMPGHVLLVIERFDEQDGITTCISRSIFETVEDRDGMLKQGMESGVTDTTDRLNELLVLLKNKDLGMDAQRTNMGGERIAEREMPIMERLEENGECITISRTFDAPVEEVWERWTDPSQYMCWWGPKDFTSPYAKFDLRPGGSYLSCMRGPDGKEYWDTGKYEEIEELSRIVYTDYFADEHGNIVPPSYYGMVGDQPVEMAVQISLETEGGKTRMTLEHCGLTDHEMLDQAKAGWNQSFDKLAACLR